ncbi:amidase [Leucobacter komagatae]|uniref:Amidase n=1 Tax=Leucobacter komagatae TaxID=55969 RepID=A0A542Y9Q9_9MICO|nr:acetamidase/formamidase family protein [Leucobacter komagatae]TQL44805.1 amidase [Leucobacter komagatae]
MTTDTQDLGPYGRMYELAPDATMAGSVVPGREFTVHTLDSSGGQIRTDVDYGELDASKFFPVVGPVEVVGVERGDVVEIEILDMDLDPVAHTWTRSGLGLLGQDRFAVMAVDTATLELRPGGPGTPLLAAAQPKAHVGALGLLTDSVEPARTLGHYGGNIDFSAVGVGAKLWITASVPGGGFFIGDVHATIGDGEVCGTGAETGASVSLRLNRLAGVGSILPTVEDIDGRLWVIGVGASVEEALKEATAYCVAKVAEHSGISKDEAYLSVGLLLNVKVCQVVNPRTSVAVSLDGGLDRVLRVVDSNQTTA